MWVTTPGGAELRLNLEHPPSDLALARLFAGGFVPDYAYPARPGRRSVRLQRPSPPPTSMLVHQCGAIATLAVAGGPTSEAELLIDDLDAALGCTYLANDTGGSALTAREEMVVAALNSSGRNTIALTGPVMSNPVVQLAGFEAPNTLISQASGQDQVWLIIIPDHPDRPPNSSPLRESGLQQILIDSGISTEINGLDATLLRTTETQAPVGIALACPANGEVVLVGPNDSNDLEASFRVVNEVLECSP